MTADSRTNSFHGLCGSLFRVGARAIVGSRWPVADDAAAAVMADFHKRLASSTEIPEQCLDKTRRAMRNAGRPLKIGLPSATLEFRKIARLNSR